MALNVGHFSNPRYDRCFYKENVYQSTEPYAYIMNTDRIHNCNGALTTFGPRSSYYGTGVSTPTGDVIAAAQQLVDIDSVMSNRNVPISKCRRGKVNPINITHIKTKDIPITNDYLDSQHSRMTDPSMFYRGTPINRFYDLNKDPQANIYYDWAINTSLEAKDNFVPELPTPLTHVSLMPDRSSPRDDTWNPRAIQIKGDNHCGSNSRGNISNRFSRTYLNNILNERKAKGKGTYSAYNY
jgi:hypothetical protein